MANCNRQQLNITCGADVVLHDRLIFEGETFDPNLSVGIAANLVSSLGKRTALSVEIVDDELLISVPWIDGTLPGCYGLEVTGSCNSKKWATYADSLIKYTKATRIGVSEVTVESDSYDITQEVGYYFSDSPISSVEATIDDEVGTPEVDVEYEHKKLTLAFHRILGDGILSMEQTVTSEESGGVNVVTVTTVGGKVGTFQIKNGEKGDTVILGDGVEYTLYNGTGRNTDGAMTQKKVTEELEVRPFTEDNNISDLDITDDNGFILARFSEGHFKTKYFDSSKDTPTIDAANSTDLDIVDGDNNVLARFANGHIRTKNFNSESLCKRQYQRATRFSYAVDCNPTTNKDFAVPTALSQYTQKALYIDNAVLYLPIQYTADGTPTKLILYCKHGASQINNGGDPILDSIDQYVFRYMLSLGYAVLGADGVPDAFASEKGICERVVGNYIAVQSMREAYDFVIRLYNIDENGSYIYGCSQGGHYAQNVIDLSGIPILAAAEVSPVCSMRYHQWDLAASGKIGGVTWTRLGRLNIARLFGFPTVSTNRQLLDLEYNQDNVQGYDPWTRNVENPYNGFDQNSSYANNLWTIPSGTQLSDITMKKKLKCPLKIWCAENDDVVGVDVTKVFIQAARNAGCVADMHLYEDGAHSIQNSQEAIGSFSENGETCDLYPLAYEIGLWYSQFGGYENINI